MAKKNVYEKYLIRIEVRDENGKLIKDENGTKHIAIQYDVEMLTDNMEFNLRSISKTLKAWMPNRQINLEALVHNKISGTYMVMFSYYVDENKFIKH